MRLYQKINFLVVLVSLFTSCNKDRSLPTVITNDVTGITATSAISGGIVQNDGGAQIVFKGICWSTTEEPTIENQKTIENTEGTFMSNITNLQPATKYYVCAYATNSVGTSYGQVISFTTLGNIPLINNLSVINLKDKSATINCSINPGDLNTIVTFEWGTTTSYGNTVTVNQNIENGISETSSSSDLINLQPQTTYNFRVKVTNDLGSTYSDNYQFTTYAVTDADGNGYYSVTIGTQVWLTQDLKTTKYNDGTSIPNVTDATAWGSLVTGAYCNYNNSNDENLIRTYGRLYNWYAVNTGKLAPEGWHVPTNNDFYALINYLGGDLVAGGKLKESGTSHWLAPNTGASNETSYSALPSGYRGSVDFPFQGMGSGVFYWSSYDPGIYIKYVNVIVLRHNDATAQMFVTSKPFGLAVRLIKD